MRSFIDHKQESWPECLAMAEFAYNNKAQASTKASPFFVNTGKHLRMGFEPRREGKHPAATEFVEKMKGIHEEAQAALKKSQDDMKVYADRKRSEAPHYKVGNKVMFSTKDLALANRPTRKFMEKWIGPYKVKKIVSTNAIELEFPKTMAHVHPVVNVSRVKPWKAPMEGQIKPPPPPVMIEGEKEYEVEEIIDSRKRRGKLEYLVQWKGYTAEERTREPAANVQNGPEKIDEYRKKYPDAIKHIRDMSRPQDLPGRHTAKLLFGWEDGKFCQDTSPDVLSGW